MSRRLLPAVFLACSLPIGAHAAAPRVAADIAPVHSLVARVMAGVGTPDLIVPAGASPHGHSLRPSEAEALQSADVVFWTGTALTPWLEGALATLADGAEIVALTELDGVHRLDVREDAVFEMHDHDSHTVHDPHTEHAHATDEYASHEHREHEHRDRGHDEVAEHDADAASHTHTRDELDPHAWLAPRNAAQWLDAIATVLARTDDRNATAYRANATAAIEEIDALEATIAERLAPVRDTRFVVFHDAYQYFEDAFDLAAAGAISLSDASDPSPARVAQIRQRIHDENITCVLAEPQFNDSLVATVTDGIDVRTSVIDPLGVALEPGAALYPTLMREMADSLADCL